MPDATFCARRAALADRAAHLTAAGRPVGTLLPVLARLTTRELLAAPLLPCPAAADLTAVLQTTVEAAILAARRRPGWLRCRLPGEPLPVAAPARYIQAAVLAALGQALQTGQPAAVCCYRVQGAAILLLQGGAGPARAPRLLAGQLARQAGGVALAGAQAPFPLLLRLPLAPQLPIKKAGPADELLADRYSLLYQYMGRFCALPDL